MFCLDLKRLVMEKQVGKARFFFFSQTVLYLLGDLLLCFAWCCCHVEFDYARSTAAATKQNLIPKFSKTVREMSVNQ